MRKLFLLFAACLLAMSGMAQETADLAFLEAYGPVKSVHYAYISNVTADGKPTNESTRSEGVTYFLDRQGRITSAVYQDQPLQISRDKQGRISRVKMPASRDTKEDDSYSYTVVWNKDNRPQKIVIKADNWSICTDTYIYGYTKLGEISVCEVEESEGTEAIKSYCVVGLEDLYGNWTKRLEILVYPEIVGDYPQSLSFDLQVRTIQFY